MQPIKVQTVYDFRNPKIMVYVRKATATAYIPVCSGLPLKYLIELFGK